MEYSINSDKTHEVSPKANYECEICDLRFKLKKCFNLHIRNTHKVYACDKCNYKNQALTSVTEHAKKDHPQPSTSIATSKASTRAKYQCGICNLYSYEKKNSLYVHIQSHHTEYACDNCKYTNKKFSLLTEHVKTIRCQTSTSTGVPIEASIKTEYHCTICDLRFKLKNYFYMHIRNTHKVYACYKCNYKNQALTSVTEHVKKDHPQSSKSIATSKATTRAKYQCEICNNYGYEKEKSLFMHIKRCHTEYACHNCNYASTEFSLLTEHVKENRCQTSTSTGVPVEASIKTEYHCTICNRRFELKKFLNLHISNTHRVYACDNCNYKNEALTSVTEHVKKNHPQPSTSIATSEATTRAKYQCKICNKYCYKHKLLLNFHIKTMHTEYACDKCVYTSKSFDRLTEHVIRNCSKLPTSIGATSEDFTNALYQCKICGKVCNVKIVLKMHYHKFHKKDNKFECNKCEYRSEDVTHVENHMKVHSHTSMF